MKSIYARGIAIACLAVLTNFYVNCSDVGFDQSSSSNGAQGAAGSADPDGDASGTIGQNGGPNGPGTGTGTPGTGTGVTIPPIGSTVGGNGTVVPGVGPGATVIAPGTGTTANPSTPGATTGGNASVTPVGTGNSPAAILPKVRFIGPECIRLSNCEVEFRLDKVYPAQIEFNWRTDDEARQCSTNPVTPPLVCALVNVHYRSNNGRAVFPPGVTSVKVFIQNINQQNVGVRIGVWMSACQYNSLSESCLKFFP